MAGDDARGYTPRTTPQVPRATRDAYRRPAAPRRSPSPSAQPATPPRRFKPQRPWVYKMRRIVAVLLILVLIVGFIRACVPSEHDREMKAWKEQANQAVEQPIDVGDADIPPSRPVEMRIPSLDMTAKFEDGDCRFKDGAIDPDALSEACAFTAKDKPYVLPGTTSEDIVVIAGHAAAGVPAVFDKLYDVKEQRHTVNPGDTMYLKTQESGDRWLKYQATDLHEPDKKGLSQSAEIWGNVPMPGRLLTISCIQPANPFEDAVRNAVIGWQLQGVVDQPE